MASSIPTILTEFAENDDPSLSWEVTHNQYVTRVQATTRTGYGSAAEAYDGALELLAKVLGAGDGYELINRAAVGVAAEAERLEAPENGLQLDAGSWRGTIDVVLSPNR